MLTPSAQIRVSGNTAKRLNVVAGIWGLSIRETADRVFEAFLAADPKLAKLVRQAVEHGEGK